MISPSRRLSKLAEVVLGKSPVDMLDHVDRLAARQGGNQTGLTRSTVKNSIILSTGLEEEALEWLVIENPIPRGRIALRKHKIVVRHDGSAQNFDLTLNHIHFTK